MNAFISISSKKLCLTAIALSALVVTGCATTTGLSKSQCEQLNLNTADWQALGQQDGLLGRDASYFAKHMQACAKVANMSPTVMTTPTAFITQNQQAWETGRQAGLKKYCTPLRAYQLGREGFSYQNVCPQEQMVELLKAHDEGYLNYQREQMMNQLWYDDDPFWGSPFDHRSGRYRSYGRLGGWIRPPISHTLPNYIEQEDKSSSTSPSSFNQPKIVKKPIPLIKPNLE